MPINTAQELIAMKYEYGYLTVDIELNADTLTNLSIINICLNSKKLTIGNSNLLRKYSVLISNCVGQGKVDIKSENANVNLNETSGSLSIMSETGIDVRSSINLAIEKLYNINFLPLESEYKGDSLINNVKSMEMVTIKQYESNNFKNIIKASNSSAISNLTISKSKVKESIINIQDCVI